MFFGWLSGGCCEETPWANANWGGKGFGDSCFHILVHHWGKSGQELKQAAIERQELVQRPSKEECCFLCFWWLLYYRIRTQAQGWAAMVGWTLPHQSLNKKMPYSVLNGEFKASLRYWVQGQLGILLGQKLTIGQWKHLLGNQIRKHSITFNVIKINFH